MNKTMENKLREYIGQDKLISVYSDTSEPDCFDLGFVLAADENFVLLNTVNTNGEESGFLLRDSDDIFMVCYDLPYAQKMQKLFALKKQEKRKICIIEGYLWESIFVYAEENHKLIKVNDDDNYIGYVENHQNHTLTLHMMDDYGNDRGMAYIDFDYINILETDTKYLQDLQLLYGEKH